MDLIDLLTKVDFLSPFLGISLNRKLQKEPDHMDSISNYVNLSSLLMSACVGVFILTFVPFEYENILLLFGDAPTIAAGSNRSLLSPIELGYMMMPFLFILVFYLENYKWLLRANQSIGSFRLIRPSSKRYQKLISKIKLYLIVCPFVVSSSAITLVSASYFLYPERTKRFPIEKTLPGSIYAVLVHYLINAVVLQFIARIYVMIRFTRDLYKKLNFWVKTQVKKKSLSVEQIFEEYFEEFSRICLMFNHLRGHVKIYFVIVVIALAPSCVLLLYIPLHRHEQLLIIRIISGCFWVLHIGCIVWFGSFIGAIFKSACELESIFYEFFHFRMNSNKRTLPDILKTKFQRYFHIVWDHEVGVQVFGKTLHSNSIVSMLIQNLGYIALAVSNIVKINKYIKRHY